MVERLCQLTPPQPSRTKTIRMKNTRVRAETNIQKIGWNHENSIRFDRESGPFQAARQAMAMAAGTRRKESASATCWRATFWLPARSAMVRATLSVR